MVSNETAIKTTTTIKAISAVTGSIEPMDLRTLANNMVEQANVINIPRRRPPQQLSQDRILKRPGCQLAERHARRVQTVLI